MSARPEDYVEYPLLEDDVVNALVDGLFASGWQVLAHCNGGRSGDQFLNVVDKATRKHGLSDRRPVMIHAQTVREDQLDRMKALGVMPSFFVAHRFYWGDWHRDAVFGPERAHRISLVRSTLDRDMPFTVHNDTQLCRQTAGVCCGLQSIASPEAERFWATISALMCPPLSMP